MDRERDTAEYERKLMTMAAAHTVAFVFCQPSLLPFSPFLGMTQWLTFPSVSCKVDRSSVVHNTIQYSTTGLVQDDYTDYISHLVRVRIWNY